MPSLAALRPAEPSFAFTSRSSHEPRSPHRHGLGGPRFEHHLPHGRDPLVARPEHEPGRARPPVATAARQPLVRRGRQDSRRALFGACRQALGVAAPQHQLRPHLQQQAGASRPDGLGHGPLRARPARHHPAACGQPGNQELERHAAGAARPMGAAAARRQRARPRQSAQLQPRQAAGRAALLAALRRDPTGAAVSSGGGVRQPESGPGPVP